MQVARTLWPDIKSQILLEYRFRLKWTKCSPKTQLKQVKTGRDQRGADKEDQGSLLDEAVTIQVLKCMFCFSLLPS
jgi:hypothetical protein